MLRSKNTVQPTVVDIVYTVDEEDEGHRPYHPKQYECTVQGTVYTVDEKDEEHRPLRPGQGG